MRYRAGPRSAYIVRPVDDLTLIHHRPAGSTHVVAPVVVAILETLHERARDVEAVVRALGKRHVFTETDGDVRESIALRLEELADMDIIDRLP